MSNKLKELRAKEGFTIIEVIIVLVIGAVIMLAVFLVVPQLQRTQRNSRRQSDARRVLTAAEQVNSNTGSYPATDTTAANQPPSAITAITGALKAPSGTDYSFGSTAGTPGADNLQYTYNSYTCTNNSPTATTSSGKVVVMVQTEGATNSVWCVSN